ncbi:hypothetical protein EP7_004084 [Isosphaeraceae bacterium EP7]
MGDGSQGNRSADDWRRIHALGLPSGSIRALLAVMIFATTWGMLVLRPSQEVPDYLANLLFIIMGHYFASRHRAEHGQEPESGPPPLWLPSGTIRLVLLAGCAAVAALLYRRGQLTEVDRNPGVVTLLLVGGFLIGVVANGLATRWRERGHLRHRGFEDVRALGAMAAAVALVGLVWNRLFPYFPPEQADALFARWIHFGRFGPEHLLASFVGFYFGSRS